MDEHGHCLTCGHIYCVCIDKDEEEDEDPNEVPDQILKREAQYAIDELIKCKDEN